MASEPIHDDELASIRDALSWAPREFRQRLVRVLVGARDDLDDGKIVLEAEVAGPSRARWIRKWEACFRSTGRPRKKRGEGSETGPANGPPKE